MSGDNDPSAGPKMDQWRAISRTYRAEWTGRGQGVATDGISWFVAQNDHRPGISRYSADFTTREATLSIGRDTAGHVGAISLSEGLLHVALEGPEQMMVVGRDLENPTIVAIERPVERDDKKHLAWCAINPANQLLYTCDWNDAVRLDAYDPVSGQREPGADIGLANSVHRTQGGVFSERGRVYLASDGKLTFLQQIRSWLGPLGGAGSLPSIRPGIHGFDTATGQAVGYVAVPTRPHLPHFEEIEGLGIGPMTVGGVLTHIHLAVLDKNHSWVADDVHIKSYEVPRPDLL